MKVQYCELYEALQRVQAEVTYCQRLVEQCRARLLTEFEAWYQAAFLGEAASEQNESGMRDVSRHCV